MNKLFDNAYFKVNESGLSPFQNMIAHMGGATVQAIGDNPITTYRQLVQQYAKNSKGEMISPQKATAEANKVFMRSPITSSLSGLQPRLVGVFFKRIPTFGFFLGYDYISGGKGEPGFIAATSASIFAAPFINPIRMIEKQQRTSLNTGTVKSVKEILTESATQKYAPLFRGTVPLIGHSFVSAILGLVGQPKLQKYVKEKIGENTSFSRSTSNLIASTIISPIYVVATNPIVRLEVIMQTNSIKGKSISLTQAIKELTKDTYKFGLAGIFRGQGSGIIKAIISLTLFHEGRLLLTDQFKISNT